ncbi:MAG TPA: DUF397 domain-containing protein [Trebonia sp.]
MASLDGGWRKSSYSGTSGGNCVEVADTAKAVLVRDTAKRGGVTLAVSVPAWRVLLGNLKNG